MATVPIQTSPTQQLSGAGLPAISAGPTNAPVMQDVAGRQAQAMGKTLSDAGSVMLKIQDSIDETSAKNADNLFVQQATDSLWSDGGFFTLKGEPAAMQYKPSVEKLSKIREGLAGTLRGNARTMFLQASDARLTALSGQMTQHAAKEYNSHKINVTSNSLEMNIRQGAMNFNDPKFLAQSLVRIDEEAKNLAGLTGGDADGLAFKSKSSLFAAAVVGVVSGDTKDKYAVAKSILADHKADLTLDDWQRVEKVVNDGYDMEQGERLADYVQSMAGQPITNQSSVIDLVMQVEGSSLVPNDNGRGMSRYGITEKSYKGEDIANITKDRAKQLYTQLWKDAGIDSLPENMRAIAFSTAVNMGTSKMKEFAAKANGDVVEFMRLREAGYRAIVKKNPGNAKYLNGWLNRMQEEMKLFYGPASMEAQAKQIEEKSENPRQAEVGKAKLRKDDTERKAIQAADEANIYNTALDLRDRGESIPPAIWSRIPDAKKTEFVNPIAETPKSILDQLEGRPELWNAAGLTPFRGRMSTTDYQMFMARGSKSGEVDTQSLNTVMLKYAMDQAGLGGLYRSKSTKNQEKYVELQAEILRDLNATERAFKRKLTNEERDKMIRSSLKKVKVKAVGFFGSTTMEKFAYQVEDPINNVLPLIPESELAHVNAILKDRGITQTPENQYNVWLLLK